MILVLWSCGPFANLNFWGPQFHEFTDMVSHGP